MTSASAKPRTGEGRVHHRADLAASAQEVWALIGPFDSLPHWHPLVAECPLETEKGSGAILRHIRLHDGRIIVNRLTGQSDAERYHSYELVEGPLPVVFYRSTLRVLEREGGGCTLDWLSVFDAGEESAEEVARRVTSLIGPGVAALKRRFGGDA